MKPPVSTATAAAKELAVGAGIVHCFACAVRQCLDEAYLEPDCQCFMFRSRRANLVKRLWKCKAAAKTTRARATDRDDASDAETAPSLDEAADELETKSLAQSMLKRLDEQHLETLIQAVESRGAEPTDCVLLSRDELRLGNRTIAPHVFCCRLWRWPRLDAVGGEGLLKRLPCCWAAGHDRDADVVCCNPYHWSRLVLPGGHRKHHTVHTQMSRR